MHVSSSARRRSAAAALVALSLLSALPLTAAAAKATDRKPRPPDSTPTTTTTRPARQPTQLSTNSTLDPIVLWICGGTPPYPCWRDSRTYHATLTSDGEPVRHAGLTFLRTDGSLLCTAGTGDDGSASCKSWPAGAPNPTYDYSYSVVFAGDEVYEPSSADSGTIPGGVG